MGQTMTKQSLYTAKHKWTRGVIRASKEAKLIRKPLDLIRMSHRLYKLGARGEELWDIAFALDCTPEYLFLIGDTLTLVEDFSNLIYERASREGISGCRKYVNLKCTRG